MLLFAAKKEKIADYTGVIAQAGKTLASDVDASCQAHTMNYGGDPDTVVVPLNAGASASTSISRSSRATSRWAGTPTRKPCRKS
jgi:hypothetical protein